MDKLKEKYFGTLVALFFFAGETERLRKELDDLRELIRTRENE